MTQKKRFEVAVSVEIVVAASEKDGAVASAVQAIKNGLREFKNAGYVESFMIIPESYVPELGKDE